MFNREKNLDDLKTFDLKTDSNSTENTTATGPAKNKTRLIIVLAVILAILACIGISYYAMKKKAPDVEMKNSLQSTMFIPIEEVTVNLRTNDDSHSWLRVKVTLEVHGKNNYDVAVKMMPKIIDVFQTYLKELRKTDLDGSFGIYKMKDEMLMRINTMLYPAQIEGVFFQEIIMQTN